MKSNKRLYTIYLKVYYVSLSLTIKTLYKLFNVNFHLFYSLILSMKKQYFGYICERTRLRLKIKQIYILI